MPDRPDHPDRVRFEPADRPRARSDVEAAVFDGEAVLFDESAAMVHQLGAIAGAVWTCCDGTSTVDDVVGELSALFATDRTELTPIVHEILHRLDDEGLLERTPTTTESDAAATDSPTVVTAPPDP